MFSFVEYYVNLTYNLSIRRRVMNVVWFFLFLLLLILEIATVNLVSIWFAIGALFSFATSFFTNSILVQVIVFILASGCSLMITKPIVKKMRKREIHFTNADRIIGKKGLVLRRIEKYHPGEVSTLGSIWTAVSDIEIEEGEEVVVERIDGVKIWVKKTKS